MNRVIIIVREVDAGTLWGFSWTMFYNHMDRRHSLIRVSQTVPSTLGHSLTSFSLDNETLVDRNDA